MELCPLPEEFEAILDSRLDILGQVEAGSNPFSLVLTETIIDLDKFSETR